MNDTCPKCNGRGLTTYNGSKEVRVKCSACTGTGKNHAWRKRRAEENREREYLEHDRLTAQMDEISMAIEQFEIKTNLDGVLVEAAKESLKSLYFRRLSYKARPKSKDE